MSQKDRRCITSMEFSEMQKTATKEPYKHMEIHPVDKYYGDWMEWKDAELRCSDRGMITTYNHDSGRKNSS